MDEPTAKAITAGSVAVAEVAKLGGKVVDAGGGAATYLARTIGTIPEDLLGLIGGDWLHEKRRRNLAHLQARTAKILEAHSTLLISEPSPSVVVPLLQAAANESRSELQELWAALLATALQQDGGTRVRRAYFETLQKMESLDALLFREIVEAPPRTGHEYLNTGDLGAKIGLAGPAFAVAQEALVRLGLYTEQMSGPVPTQYGRAFWNACSPAAESLR